MYARTRDDKVTNARLAMASEVLTSSRRVLQLLGPLYPYNVRHDPHSPSAVICDLLALSLESNDPVTIIVGSGGGDVGTGFELYDAIRMAPMPVTMIAMNVASMATLVLAAGERRLMMPHARAMLHLPRLSAKELDMDEKEFNLAGAEMKKIREVMIDCYIERGVKRTKETMLDDMDRMYWMSADQCLEYGLIDGIVTPAELYGLRDDCEVPQASP